MKWTYAWQRPRRGRGRGRGGCGEETSLLARIGPDWTRAQAEDLREGAIETLMYWTIGRAGHAFLFTREWTPAASLETALALQVFRVDRPSGGLRSSTGVATFNPNHPYLTFLLDEAKMTDEKNVHGSFVEKLPYTKVPRHSWTRRVPFGKW